MNKRGQLTIFIIVGIVLLFSAALTIYVQRSIASYRPDVQITVEQTSAELQPLQSFVTECLRDVSTEAIRLAGVQGGYVDASLLRVNDEDPTAAEALSLSPGSDLKVPYWYYMRSHNSCTSACEFSTKQPALYRDIVKGNSVEEQIDAYVQKNLASCLREFRSFPQFTVEQRDLSVKTTIARTDVFVETDFNIQIASGDRVEQLTRFAVKLPVNLGKFFDTATQITKKQEQSGFLDFLAVNVISPYARLDGPLPPLSEYTFTPGKQQSWSLDTVEADITELLSINVPGLQVQGTTNFNPNIYEGDDELARGMYRLFTLPLNKTTAVGAEFTYLPWWPAYVDINPRQGTVIRPESVSGINQILSFIGFNEYKFGYDISYPVLVTLTDADSFEGAGFVFQFAIESNLRSNEPMKSSTSILTSPSRAKQTLACSRTNYNSANVTFIVNDSITAQLVDGATLYFQLGKEACPLGDTNLNGRLITQMPVGIGSLVVTKEGYLSKSIPFAPSLDEEKIQNVELDSFVELNVSVARIPVIIQSCGVTDYDVIGAAGDLGQGIASGTVAGETGISEEATGDTGIAGSKYGGAYGTARALKDRATIECFWGPVFDPSPGLGSKEFSVVTLSRKADNPTQDDYVVTLQFNGSDDETSVLPARLAPGIYSLSGILVDDQKTIIPEDEVCYEKDFFDMFLQAGKNSCDPIKEVVFDAFQKGGIELANVIILPSDLKGKREMTIYLLSVPDGYNREPDGTTDLMHVDLEQMGKVDEYSRDYFGSLRPSIR